MGAKGSISLTFNDLTPAVAATLLAVAGGQAAAPAAAPVTVAAPAPAPAPVAPVAPPAPPAAPVAAAAPGITLEHIVAAVKTFAQTPGKGGATKVKEILGKYGVAAAIHLKPEHYAQAYADFTA